MTLTGAQIQQLQQALLSAFPTHSVLAQMVLFGMNERLAVIASGNLGDSVVHLVEWAEANGRTEELLLKAREQNPGNPLLQSTVNALLPHVRVAGTASTAATPAAGGATVSPVTGSVTVPQATGGLTTTPASGDGKIRVLFLGANPKSTAPLALDEEIREITAKIRAADHRDSIELTSRWAVRPDDLLQAMEEIRPHIVHFSGHGSETEEIYLLDESRNPKPVSKAALESLFRVLKDNVQVVVFNACFSRPQAEAVVQTIDCAIGMNKAIGDRAARVFAASFYRAIGFGRSVRAAFDQGVTALLLEGIPAENIPELLVREGVDAGEIVLTRA